MTDVKRQRVGVGLSGGVDSAAAALRLLEDGHEVLGFTMVLTAQGESTVAKARLVAERLGIPLATVDLRREFDEQVLEPFVAAYAAGRTPSPCVVCNARFKFGVLWERMREHGCGAMATGHYARVVRPAPETPPELHRGADPAKDQSYFLAQLTHAQLARAVFPLGDCLKADVKARMATLGIVPPSEGESQDLCFLAQGDYASMVLARRPDLNVRGPILDGDGQRLGTHDGAFRYTPGQRRGLGLGGGPWFVRRTDMTANAVVVAQRQDMRCRRLRLSGLNWLDTAPPTGQPLETTAQIRHLMKPRPAAVVRRPDGDALLDFHENILAAPPGQLAVLYDGTRVVASGWIDGTED